MKKSRVTLTNSAPQIISENFVLNINQVTKVLGISRTTLDKYRKEDSFPKPLKRSARPKWITEEIIKWAKTV